MEMDIKPAILLLSAASVFGADLNHFLACDSGPGVPSSSECRYWDFDGDSDIDTSDFGVLQMYMADLLVPTEYPTIQDAVFAAQDGDTITVSSGIYAEGPAGGYLNLGGSGRTLTIRAMEGADVTVTNNGNTAYVVRVSGDADVTLEGLNFDGNGVTTSGNAGIVAVTTPGGNLTLSNCRLEGTGTGGNGIFVYNPAGCGCMTISECSVSADGAALKIAAPAEKINICRNSALSNNGSIAAVYVSPGASGTVADITVCDESTVTAHGANADAFYQQNGIIASLSVNGSAGLRALGTGKGLSLAGAVRTMSLGPARLEGGYGVYTTSTSNVTSLNAANMTSSGIQFLGTITGANLTDCVVNGRGVSFRCADDVAKGTRITIQGGTYSALGNASAISVPKNFQEVFVADASFSSMDGVSPAVSFGMEMNGTNSNDSPLGHLHFCGNTVSKTGTRGHCAIFGMGGGKGMIVGNTFTGGDYGLVLKSQGDDSDRYTVIHNKLDHPGAHVAMYLAGVQFAVIEHNIVVNTTGTALCVDTNQNSVACRYNTVRNNSFQSTSGYVLNDAADPAATSNLIDYNLYYSSSATPFRIKGVDQASLDSTRVQWSTSQVGTMYAKNDQHSELRDISSGARPSDASPVPTALPQ